MKVHNDGHSLAASVAADRRTQVTTGGAAIATLLTAMLLLLFLAGPACAATTGDQPRLSDYPVIVDANQKIAPATDGATVVWGESTADGWGIYAVCVDKARSGQVALADASRVALVSGQPSHLAVCGDAVAWQLGEGATGSVWLGNTCGDDPVCVSAHGIEPALADGVIVWVDFAQDAAGDIVAATTEDPTTIVAVCADVGAQSAPAVSHQLVVWQDMRNGNWDIYGAKLDGSGVAPPAAQPDYPATSVLPDSPVDRGPAGATARERPLPSAQSGCRVPDLHGARRPDRAERVAWRGGLDGRPRRRQGHLGGLGGRLHRTVASTDRRHL